MKAAEATNFDFRGVDEQSLGRFSDMFKECFGLTVDENYFRWKYLENPAGRVVAFEALDGSRPAAFYGVIPEQWRVSGSLQVIYQSMDTATHPDYQRRGLFVKLAKMTYATLGDAAIIGFPGDQSYPGFVQKLGWKHVADGGYLFANRTLWSIQKPFRSRPRLNFELIDQVTPELSSFLSRFRSPATLAKELSPAFFNWRVFRHPLHRYKVLSIGDGGGGVGCCIYRQDTEKSCSIEWLGFERPTHYATHVSAVISHLFERTGMRYLYTWIPTEKHLKEGYARAGLLRNRTSYGPFRDHNPFIVYKGGDEPGPWFGASNYDLQPFTHD